MEELLKTEIQNDIDAEVARLRAYDKFRLADTAQSAKAHFDDCVALLRQLNQPEGADYWTEQRNRVLSAFGSVRTKSSEGSATKNGIDYGAASLAKVLKHLNTPKRHGALLGAAWAMVHAATVE